MKSKKIRRLKLATTVGLLLIVMGSFAYGAIRAEKVRRDKIVDDKVETIVNDTFKKTTEKNVPLRDSIVSFGRGLLGTPYVTAACNKDGFDCSGFVYYVFQHFNIQVPRSSSLFSNFGKEIAIDKVRKGDILLFLSPTRNVIGHVGIVSKADGNQSDFIHASSGREMKVIISSLKQQGYTRRFVKAVRVL